MQRRCAIALRGVDIDALLQQGTRGFDVSLPNGLDQLVSRCGTMIAEARTATSSAANAVVLGRTDTLPSREIEASEMSTRTAQESKRRSQKPMPPDLLSPCSKDPRCR